MKKIVVCILHLILFVGGNYANVFNYERIPRGQVVDTIKCIDNRQQSYALYLPSYYTTDKKYPIIYIFEPAARGALPVNNYHNLAEEYGFILICSNNSQNGPQGPVDRAVVSVFNDTRIRFTIDTSRIYTMGFSGGARVATRIAIQQKNIKGVIGCGAGFPYELNPKRGLNFTYVGLIGDLDMNYFEMKLLENSLNNIYLKHYMIYFKERHVWPEENEMRKAFVFLHFDAMQRGLINVDTILVEKYKATKIKQLKNDDNIYNLYVGYKEVLTHINHLTVTEDIQAKIGELTNNKTVKEIIRTEQFYLQKEADLAKTIGVAFFNPEKYNMQWWKNETLKLNKAIIDSLDVNMMFIAKRMINKIYLLAFENYMLNKQKLDLNQSVRIFKLAAYAKPESPYPDYFLAAVYSKNKKETQALKMLQKSIEKGFSNLAHLQNDKSFDNLRAKKKYIEIEKQIKPQ